MSNSGFAHFMRAAMRQAEIAAAHGEIPVGAVIVRDGVILARGRNRREEGGGALAHAECEAIRKACKKLGTWHLDGCELYVTLEPCPMCAGAAINARIARVIFGAYDPKAGSCGSMIDLFALPYNHRPELIGGVLEEACSAQLTSFFRALRRRRKEERAQGR